MNENIKIVVVDDEKPIRDIFKQYVESTTPYTVLTAGDGLQALEIISRQEIDCCFLDLSMPRMSGIELARRIHDYDNTIPLVVMTGHPTLDNAVKTLQNGVVDFLTKPVDMPRIALTINRVMREKSLLADNFLLKEQARKNDRLLEINQVLQQKVKDVEIMNLILQELDRASSSQDLFGILVDLAGRITACDQAHFYIFSPEKKEHDIISSFIREGKNPAPGTLIDSGTIKKVARDDMPVIMRGHHGSGSMMAIPLKIRNTVFGILVLLSAKTARFNEKDLYFTNFLTEKASYLIENLALYENIYENLFSTLYAFVETIEARDPYTRQHSTRVSKYAMSIARSAACPQEDIDKLNVAGYLHDIGKIGIPDNILLKPGRLTDAEYEIIKTHPIISSNIIGHLGMWLDEQKIIRHHHERYDGKGYPDALGGEDIPFLSRILAVADVYDALTSDRSYRKKMPEQTALNIIRENSGTQFDAGIVDIFLELHHHQTTPRKAKAC